MRLLYILIFSFLLSPTFGNSQILEPVKWTFSKKEISENVFELTFVADIEEGWAVYSKDIYNTGVDCEIEICPVPVTFEYNQDSDSEKEFYLLGDGVEEDTNKKVSQDPIFLMEVTKFEKQAVFRQTIELENKDMSITGFLTFMTCDDTKCLPPTDVDFSFSFGESQEVAKNVIQNKQDVIKNNLLLYGFLPEDIIKQSADCNNSNSTCQGTYVFCRMGPAAGAAVFAGAVDTVSHMQRNELHRYQY